MTDDGLDDVQPSQIEPFDVSPAVAAALAYVDGLHAFVIALVRCDVDAMQNATDRIEAAALAIANQAVIAATDAR